MKVKVAVVGATGVVGRMMLKVLAERKFPISELHLSAPPKRAATVREYTAKKKPV